MVTDSADYCAVFQNLVRLWGAVDKRAYEQAIALLTDDCRWFRDRWRTGKADILQALERRPPSMVSRHIVSNLIMRRTPRGYDCTFSLLALQRLREQESEIHPFAVNGFQIGDGRCETTLDGGEWLFSEMHQELIFNCSSPL